MKFINAENYKMRMRMRDIQNNADSEKAKLDSANKRAEDIEKEYKELLATAK